jgi:Flp pilus assembly protein TadB
MSTMEFDHLQKIWDAQSNQTVYAIDESTLHRRVLVHKRKSERIHRINTYGLVAISVVCSAILLGIKVADVFNIVSSIVLMVIAVYVLIRDHRRKKALQVFDRTMAGELDFAIENIRYQIRFGQTFWLWYVIPLALPKLAEMLSGKINYPSIAVMVVALIASVLVVRWEVNSKYKPKLRQLESLKSSLETET